MQRVSTFIVWCHLWALVHAFRSGTPQWRASFSLSAQVDETNDARKHVVVVGGGWAGFSAADALVRAAGDDVLVTLLDAAPRGKGGLAGGWRTDQGRPIEAGIHGFWRDYRNTFAVLERLNIPIDSVLTPYTPSVLYSSSGKVAVAPVMQGGAATDKEDEFHLTTLLPSIVTALRNGNQEQALKSLANLLPAPLDLALLADFNPDSPLTALDRISAIGLLGAWSDFGQEDPQSWQRYDKVNAQDLFLENAGVTQTLYDELVAPMLHVLPMGPGHSQEISAAAALSCFHTFGLAAPGSFDVRWCNGAIAEQIFNPWAETLTSQYGVDIRGSTKVSAIDKVQTNGLTKFKIATVGHNDTIECDAVIMAVGGTAMGRLAPASSAFDDVPVAQKFDKLRGVTCVAVRMFLKPQMVTANLQGGQFSSTELHPETARAMFESPVAVCGPKIGRIPELNETGFCIYDLQRLHKEFSVSRNNENRTAALEVDFFRADAIADLSDDKQIAELALLTVAKTLGVAPIPSSDIVDLAVVRARNAVSYFCVGSNSRSPPTKLYPGLYMSGDWVDRSGHASWSTEKAVVTGRQAVNQLLRDFKPASAKVKIIPAPPDSPQLSALRIVTKFLRSVAPPPGNGIPPSPWAFLKSLLDRDS